MGRFVWPLALVVTFGLGWAAAGLAPQGLSIVSHRDDETVTRLKNQVETLQARLRAREDLVAARQAASSGSASHDSAAAARAADPSFVRELRAAQGAKPSAATTEKAAANPAAKAAPVSAAQVQAALDKFYRYLETQSGRGGPERWRQARELMDEMKAMGPAAGQALLQVLSAGNDMEERRAAARMLGNLQVAHALPMLKDIVEREGDLLLRRAAASGLRQLQTPESLPVLERMLAQPGEDRFVRLSAAVGLAESGRQHGVTGLVQIFEETTSDGRGREMAFRALANLKDERPLPFMRQVAVSQAEPGYRLQAIRYLSAQNDQQSLTTLQMLSQSPTEQPSIRDAAAAAYSALGGK
jgi:HEAT repeat protein